MDSACFKQKPAWDLLKEPLFKAIKAFQDPLLAFTAKALEALLGDPRQKMLGLRNESIQDQIKMHHRSRITCR